MPTVCDWFLACCYVRSGRVLTTLLSEKLTNRLRWRHLDLASLCLMSYAKEFLRTNTCSSEANKTLGFREILIYSIQDIKKD